MEAHFVRTDRIYRDIINAKNEAERKQIYREKLVQPWQQMMTMVSGMGNNDSSDEFAGARAWNWILPDELHTAPELLEKLEAVNAWQVGCEALEKAVKAFASFIECIPFDKVEGWLILADPERSDPIMRGYTGGIDFMQPRFVCQYDTLTEDNIRALPGCIVHEFNHLVRLKTFPWSMETSVADYIIHEGMAESFAKELFGEEVLGYYVTDFDESQVDTAKALIKNGLDKTGFNLIRAYIFGEHWSEKSNLPKIAMPSYGGYAIGYRVVQAFLERAGCSVAEATFLSAQQIIEESGYFD